MLLIKGLEPAAARKRLVSRVEYKINLLRPEITSAFLKKIYRIHSWSRYPMNGGYNDRKYSQILTVTFELKAPLDQIEELRGRAGADLELIFPKKVDIRIEGEERDYAEMIVPAPLSPSHCGNHEFLVWRELARFIFGDENIIL